MLRRLPKCLFMNLYVVNVTTNSKNWFLAPLRRSAVPGAKARRSAAECRPLPLRAVESLRVQQVHPAEAALPVVAPVAASKAP